jgi:hypothetical protein
VVSFGVSPGQRGLALTDQVLHIQGLKQLQVRGDLGHDHMSQATRP